MDNKKNKNREYRNTGKTEATEISGTNEHGPKPKKETRRLAANGPR